MIIKQSRAYEFSRALSGDDVSGHGQDLVSIIETLARQARADLDEVGVCVGYAEALEEIADLCYVAQHGGIADWWLPGALPEGDQPMEYWDDDDYIPY
jgi:hypothetical protein